MEEWNKLLSFIIILIGFGIHLFNITNDPAIMKQDYNYILGAFLSITAIPLIVYFLSYISGRIYKKKYNYLRIFAWTLLVMALLGLPTTYHNLLK